MTVEIEYQIPHKLDNLGSWQVNMAEQIESSQGFPISEIERELSGSTFIVRVETDLPSQAVENTLSDIEDHLPSTASHVETREV